MTEVSYGRGARRQTLRVTGHATGSPEVCAAVSGIVYSLMGYLANYGGTDCQVEAEDGRAAIAAGRSEALDAAFSTAVIGLSQIALQHPEYVTIINRRPG